MGAMSNACVGDKLLFRSGHQTTVVRIEDGRVYYGDEHGGGINCEQFVKCFESGVVQLIVRGDEIIKSPIHCVGMVKEYLKSLESAQKLTGMD